MSATKRKVLNVLLCGLGRAGKIHFHNLIVNPRTRLKYIIDSDADSARTYSDDHNLYHSVVQDCSKLEEVLCDPDLHIVVVTSPTPTHEEYVCKSLNAKKHVFCEKPIAQSIESVRNCYKKASEMDRILFCSFNRRYDPAVMTLYQRVQEKDVGNPYVVYTTSRDSPLPKLEYIKVSGGFFHDCAVHDIDVVTWILHEYPSSVYTMAHCHDPDYKALGCSDTASISLKFPSGKLGVINISRHSTYGYDQRVEVHGDLGMIESLNQRETNVQSSNASGTHLPTLLHSFNQRYAKSYVNALNDFLDIVEGKKPLLIDESVAVSVSRIADACEESLKTKQVVNLSWS